MTVGHQLRSEYNCTIHPTHSPLTAAVPPLLTTSSVRNTNAIQLKQVSGDHNALMMCIPSSSHAQHIWIPYVTDSTTTTTISTSDKISYLRSGKEHQLLQIHPLTPPERTNEPLIAGQESVRQTFSSAYVNHTISSSSSSIISSAKMIHQDAGVVASYASHV